MMEPVLGGVAYAVILIAHAHALHAVGGDASMWVAVPLYIGAVWFGRSPLGLLNFLVLQWFGARLASGVDPAEVVEGPRGRWWSSNAPPRPTPVAWLVMRWVWPLTGWWSRYRMIAPRGRARP